MKKKTSQQLCFSNLDDKIIFFKFGKPVLCYTQSISFPCEIHCTFQNAETMNCIDSNSDYNLHYIS